MTFHETPIKDMNVSLRHLMLYSTGPNVLLERAKELFSEMQNKHSSVNLRN